jgi:hypothetical protein
MKWVIGDCLSELTSIVGGSVHKTAQSMAEKNDVILEFYFAKTQAHLIDTADTGQFAAKEVTGIYLSFTNLRVSIALPGRGVSLEGGQAEHTAASNYQLPLP